MIRGTINALLACVVTFGICAVAYPLLVYGIGHTLFPRQAEGSLIEVDGKVIGSELIAQPFASDKYFVPRPSAAGATGYAADAASGSNLGTNNPALHDRIALDSAKWIAGKTSDADLKAKLAKLDAAQAELKAKTDLAEKTKADEEAIPKLEDAAKTALTDVLAKAGELGKAPAEQVPADLVTTSGAGLDPDIRPEGAFYQVDRVAAARGASADEIRQIVEANIDHSGAIIGAPARVNVLKLNLELDRLKPTAEKPPAPTPSASAPIDPATTPAAAVAPVAAVAAEAKASSAEDEIESRIVELSKRVEEIQKREVPDPSADLKAIQDRLDTLGAAAQETAKSLARLSEIDAKVTTFRQSIDAMKSEIVALHDSAKKPAEVPATAEVVDVAPIVKLVQERRLADALSVAESHPEDARGWYFSALITGMTTNQWKGETETLVAKGVACEKAGTPSSATIDTAFGTLTKETGKDWLAYYRNQAAKR